LLQETYCNGELDSDRVYSSIYGYDLIIMIANLLANQCLNLKFSDYAVPIQLLCFWALSIILFIEKTHWKLDSVSIFRWNLLSKAQLIELLPTSGHETGYVRVKATLKS
jgi:hypothetical protein